MKQLLAISLFLAFAFALPTFDHLDFDAGGNYVATGPGFSGHYFPNGTVQVNPQFNGTLVLDASNQRMYLDNSFFGKRWVFNDSAYIIIPVLGSTCFVIQSNYSNAMTEYARALQRDLIISGNLFTIQNVYLTMAESAFECHMPTALEIYQDPIFEKIWRIAFNERINSPLSGNVAAFVDLSFNNFRSLTGADDSFFNLPAACSTPTDYATFCANYYPPNLFS